LARVARLGARASATLVSYLVLVLVAAASSVVSFVLSFQFFSSVFSQAWAALRLFPMSYGVATSASMSVEQVPGSYWQYRFVVYIYNHGSTAQPVTYAINCPMGYAYSPESEGSPTTHDRVVLGPGQLFVRVYTLNYIGEGKACALRILEEGTGAVYSVSAS